MKERPILFSAPMVRAILEERKTQTRRIIKPQPQPEPARANYTGERYAWMWESNSGKVGIFEPANLVCPYGVPGDLLWVRETWSDLAGLGISVYKADPNAEKHIDGIKWKPSIFMPRWACRLILEIINIRIERLKTISSTDAKDEGIIQSQRTISASEAIPCYWDYLKNQPEYTSPISSYASLWESINGPGSWDKNPWVWILEFKRVK